MANQDLVYSGKILLALSEAMIGNKKIYDWLLKNNYHELSIFVAAMKGDERSYTWLMDNGYPALAALISAVELDKGAFEWLIKNGYKKLALVAGAANGEEKATVHLQANDKELAILAQRIKEVKDQEDRDNNNPHKFKL